MPSHLQARDSPDSAHIILPVLAVLLGIPALVTVIYFFLRMPPLRQEFTRRSSVTKQLQNAKHIIHWFSGPQKLTNISQLFSSFSWPQQDCRSDLSAQSTKDERSHRNQQPLSHKQWYPVTPQQPFTRRGQQQSGIGPEFPTVLYPNHDIERVFARDAERPLEGWGHHPEQIHAQYQQPMLYHEPRYEAVNYDLASESSIRNGNRAPRYPNHRARFSRPRNRDPNYQKSRHRRYGNQKHRGRSVRDIYHHQHMGVASERRPDHHGQSDVGARQKHQGRRIPRKQVNLFDHDYLAPENIYEQFGRRMESPVHLRHDPSVRRQYQRGQSLDQEHMTRDFLPRSPPESIRSSEIM